jgi:hypothetical protein
MLNLRRRVALVLVLQGVAACAPVRFCPSLAQQLGGVAFERRDDFKTRYRLEPPAYCEERLVALARAGGVENPIVLATSSGYTASGGDRGCVVRFDPNTGKYLLSAGHGSDLRQYGPFRADAYDAVAALVRPALGGDTAQFVFRRMSRYVLRDPGLDGPLEYERTYVYGLDACGTNVVSANAGLLVSLTPAGAITRLELAQPVPAPELVPQPLPLDSTQRRLSMLMAGRSALVERGSRYELDSATIDSVWFRYTPETREGVDFLIPGVGYRLRAFLTGERVVERTETLTMDAESGTFVKVDPWLRARTGGVPGH